MEIWRKRAVAAVIIGLALIGEAVAGEAKLADKPPDEGHSLQCWPIAPFRAAIAQSLRLRPVGRGINALGNLTELWVGMADESWMLVIITPDGHACPLDQGPAWQGLTQARRQAGYGHD